MAPEAFFPPEPYADDVAREASGWSNQEHIYFPQTSDAREKVSFVRFFVSAGSVDGLSVCRQLKIRHIAVPMLNILKFFIASYLGMETGIIV